MVKGGNLVKRSAGRRGYRVFVALELFSLVKKL